MGVPFYLKVLFTTSAFVLKVKKLSGTRMSETVGKLPKPVMRGLLRKQIGRNLVGAFFVTAGTVMIYKIMVNNVRAEQYADFYRNYDIDKEFEKMRKRGQFDSCSSED